MGAQRPIHNAANPSAVANSKPCKAAGGRDPSC